MQSESSNQTALFNLLIRIFTLSLPPMSLTANIHYEKLASAFDNFQGFYAETKEQIKDAFQKALKETKRPSIINIAINPSADRKAQVIF
jgi:thiamine pyrophosphate-dependent acetolactate synthase large subunit-like protein